MSGHSHVFSIDDLRQLFLAVAELEEGWKNQAMALRQAGERARTWVAVEQRQYWNQQLIRAERQLQSDLNDLHRSKITAGQGNPHGSTDAQIRVQRSKQRLDLCRQRVDQVKRWTMEMERVVDRYLGRIGAFSEMAEEKLPTSKEELRRWIEALQTYSESGGAG